MNKINDLRSMWINLLIFAAILVMVNLLSMNLFTRIDLTRDSIYTLAPVSASTVGKINDRLVVKAYFTKDLPPQLAEVRQYTRDLLQDFKAKSHGKMHLEFIEIDEDEKLKQEAEGYKITPAQVNIIENDQQKQIKAYLGLVMLYQNKEESLPFIETTAGLEYEITIRLNRLVVDNLPRVAILETRSMEEMLMRAFGRIDPMQMQQVMQQIQYNPDYRNQVMARVDPLYGIKDQIRSIYDLQEVSLDMPIDPKVSVLLVPGVQDSLNTNQLYNLDQYLMSGGKIVLFQDQMRVMQDQSIQPITSRVNDMMSFYGITQKNNIVMDMNCVKVSDQEWVGNMLRLVQRDFPAVIISNSVNKDNPIAGDLSNLVFYFPSEIDIKELPKDCTFTPLVYSSENSAGVPATHLQSAIQTFTGRQVKLNGPMPLAGLLEGTFHSYFITDSTYSASPSFRCQTTEGKIIFVSGAGFFQDEASRNNKVRPNHVFVRNAIDYLTGNSEIIYLRSREVNFSPIDMERFVDTQSALEGINIQSPEGQEQLKKVQDELMGRINTIREITKWVNILLPSLLLVLLGILRHRKNIVNRNALRREYE